MNDTIEPNSPAKKRVRLLIVPAISFIVVIAVIAFSIHRITRDECYDWEEQFDLLDQSFSRYLATDREHRTGALAELSNLELACTKVAESRDLCVMAYGHLLEAEEEHLQAKAALPRVSSALLELEPRLQEAAKRCILQDQPEDPAPRELGLSDDETTALREAVEGLEPSLREVADACIFRDLTREAISRDLNAEPEEVHRRVSSAMKALGLGDVVTRHREVEEALERSNRHLADAEKTNGPCDAMFKQLQTERR